MPEFKNESERRASEFNELRKNKFFFAWWQNQHEELQSGYQGISHTLNKSISEAVSHRQELLQSIQELKDRCEKLEAERDEANATIGSLQADLVAISERLDRIADWANKQKGIEK